VGSPPTRPHTSSCLYSKSFSSCHDARVALLPPETLSPIVAAMARSAPTLTAIHGLPLPEGPGCQLGAFTQLQVMTLATKHKSPEVLRASQLPPSLEDLTLLAPEGTSYNPQTGLPFFAALDRLQNLRRITFVDYGIWWLGSWDLEEGQPCPLQLPPSLEVRTIPVLCTPHDWPECAP